MRRRFPLILTLAAWLFATGAHWDVAQTFAWGRMLAVHAKEMPLGLAVKKTFSVEGRCSLCRAIADGRAKQEQTAGTSSAPTGKVLSEQPLVSAPEEQLFFPPALYRWGVFRNRDLLAGVERAAPILAPPRAWA